MTTLMKEMATRRTGLLPYITRRFSPRVFANRRVSDEDMNALFEAARWAPSSYNEQPWSYIVAHRDDAESFGKLAEALNEKNRAWAANAPVLMLSVAKTNVERTGKANKHAFHDVGLAMGNMLNQATSMNIYMRQMGGYDAEKARELLNIPEGYEPVAMIALGYLDEDTMQSEEVQAQLARPRARKRVEEFTFRGTFDNHYYND